MRLLFEIDKKDYKRGTVGSRPSVSEIIMKSLKLP